MIVAITMYHVTVTLMVWKVENNASNVTTIATAQAKMFVGNFP